MNQPLKYRFKGYLKIRISGYSPERFLNLCKHKNIEIWGLEAKQGQYEMYMTVKGFRNLKPILRKTRTRISILERCGVPFFFYKYRARKVFFLGFFLCLFLIFSLSRFIWNIDIQGNLSFTDQVILEYLSSQDIYHGMKIRDVSCEQIVKDIRKEFDDIIWVSASLEGCNLIIAVQENTDTFQHTQNEHTASDLVATANGIITEIITRSGVPLVKVGDKVKKGDILVTGIVPVVNDAGEVIREDYKTADATVVAEVMLPYQDLCETSYLKKEYIKGNRKQVFLECSGYRLSFGLPKEKKSQQETTTTACQLQLYGNFYLPVFYGTTKYQPYVLKEEKREKEDRTQILNDNLDTYCKNLEVNGIEILEKNVQLEESAAGTKMAGYLKIKQSIEQSVDLSGLAMLE